MKYVLYIDSKAGYEDEYVIMDANNLEEAIVEADSYFDYTVYSMCIMKKDGNIKRMNGWKITKYTAVLMRRTSDGWHLNNEENGDIPFSVNHFIPKNPKEHWFAVA